jgi:hypothetical protein
MTYPQLECDLNLPTARPGQDWWIEIAGPNRWTICHRLQELAIACNCQMGQPLRVRIDSPLNLMQCWSVMRHAAMPPGNRLDLAAQLETCWKLAIKS